MRIAVASDHAGYDLKPRLIESLRAWNHEVADLGCHTPDPVDFPDLARLVADAIVRGDADRGLLVCGTGVGASIAANKIAGVRAALCHDVHSAHQAVEHDDANVLCLGAQIVGPWLAVDLLRAYFEAEFQDEAPFRRRLAKIAALERAKSADRSQQSQG